MRLTQHLCLLTPRQMGPLSLTVAMEHIATIEAHVTAVTVVSVQMVTKDTTVGA